jgi:hypothetical protein
MLNTNYINVDINSLTILDDNDEPIYIIQVVKEEAKPKQPILKQPTILLKLPIKKKRGRPSKKKD